MSPEVKTMFFNANASLQYTPIYRKTPSIQSLTVVSQNTTSMTL